MTNVEAFWWSVLARVFQREEINGDGLCPTYLIRWTLLRAFGMAIYLHKFVGADWSKDFHDHPKRFISIGLWGSYMELSPIPLSGGGLVARCYRAPWVRTFPATHVHRITGPTPEKPCWTLVIVLRATRRWGFWTDRGWVWWRDYIRSDRAKEAKACDD